MYRISPSGTYWKKLHVFLGSWGSCAIPRKYRFKLRRVAFPYTLKASYWTLLALSSKSYFSHVGFKALFQVLKFSNIKGADSCLDDARVRKEEPNFWMSCTSKWVVCVCVQCRTEVLNFYGLLAWWGKGRGERGTWPHTQVELHTHVHARQPVAHANWTVCTCMPAQHSWGPVLNRPELNSGPGVGDPWSRWMNEREAIIGYERVWYRMTSI